MNLIDKLIALDKKAFTEKETATYEVKRLSKLIGEPFMITVQAIDSDLYQDIQLEIMDKKGKVDYGKAFDTQVKIVCSGVIEPNLKDEKLQKHFGALTPKELAKTLFQGSDLMKLSELIATVSGYGSDDEEEDEEAIKN